MDFDSQNTRHPGRVGRVFRVSSGLVAAVFTLAAIVQLNDPDPARWLLVYGSAAILTALIAAGRNTPVWAAGVLALVALVWGLSLADIYRDVAPGELFQQWEMKDQRIEIAREAGGLLLIAAWMGIVIAQLSLRRRATHPYRRDPESR